MLAPRHFGTIRSRPSAVDVASAFKRKSFAPGVASAVGVASAFRRKARIRVPLNQRNLSVFPPCRAEGIAHLANGGVRPGAVEERLHRIGVTARGGGQRIERTANRVVVARALQVLEAR